MNPNNPTIRTGFIGGSDIAAVLNLEPYGCARRLWYIKSGVEPDSPFRMTGPMQMGVWAEDGIAEIAAEKWGWKLVRAKGRKREHEAVHVDRKIQKARAVEGIAEIKCIGNNAYWTWMRDGVPVGYLLQLQWGMYLHDRTWGAVIAWNRDNGDVAKFEFNLDYELIRNVRQMVSDFWQRVETGAIPDPLPQDDDRCDGCNFRATCFQAQWAKLHADAVRMDHLADALAKYNSFRGIEKDAAAAAEEYRGVIEAEMGDHQLIQIGAAPVSWKVQTSNRLDTSRLQSEQPETYAAFLKPTVSRVFRILKEKK